MQSLINAKINYGVLLGVALFGRLLFPQLSWYSYFALMIAFYQFMLLFYSLGSVIPVRYLLGSFMCLQMFVGPAFAYNGLDEFQRGNLKMQIPEAEYFMYALPAVILFIIGLHIRAKYLNGENVNREKIMDFVTENKMLPYIFIAIGFVASVVSPFFGAELGFVFVLIGGFKFIGVFLIILGNQQIKPLFLILVYGSVILSSLGEAMFHDLLIWLLFLGAILSLKYKPSNGVKLMLASIFVIFALFIQIIKGDYRDATWTNGQEAGLETLQKTVENKREKEEGLFNFEKLGASNIRINQGFIITNIMQNVPAREPFSNGEEMKQIMEAAILPRVLAPDKLMAGDREFFMKWAGFRIAQGTSMGLSSMGDAYLNFGIAGGCIFMLLYGMLFSEVLNAFNYYSKVYPVLILFVGLVFYYPIRPDCELQTIMGHLVKATFMIAVVMNVWKNIFRQT